MFPALVIRKIVSLTPLLRWNTLASIDRAWRKEISDLFHYRLQAREREDLRVFWQDERGKIPVTPELVHSYLDRGFEHCLRRCFVCTERGIVANDWKYRNRTILEVSSEDMRNFMMKTIHTLDVKAFTFLHGMNVYCAVNDPLLCTLFMSLMEHEQKNPSRHAECTFFTERIFNLEVQLNKNSPIFNGCLQKTRNSIVGVITRIFNQQNIGTWGHLQSFKCLNCLCKSSSGVDLCKSCNNGSCESCGNDFCEPCRNLCKSSNDEARNLHCETCNSHCETCNSHCETCNSHCETCRSMQSHKWIDNTFFPPYSRFDMFGNRNVGDKISIPSHKSYGIRGFKL
jgi:hypothetical protein